MSTSTRSASAERNDIQTAMETLAWATSQMPVGWFGPEDGESVRTPPVLAQAGMRSGGDWATDEPPYRLKPIQGELFALPLLLERDDLHATGARHIPVTHYAVLLTDSFEPLSRDGRSNGRLFMLHRHPWLSGQPFRIRSLDTALGTLMRRHGVWAASGRKIIDGYRQHPAVASSCASLRLGLTAYRNLGIAADGPTLRQAMHDDFVCLRLQCASVKNPRSCGAMVADRNKSFNWFATGISLID